MTFASPSERRIRSEAPPSQLPAGLALASRGIHSMVDDPLLRHSSLASTPGGVAATVGRPDACPDDSFRPHGFAPSRRFSPRMRSQACCIPVPEGVRSVSATCGHSPAARRQHPPDESAGDGGLVGRRLPRLRSLTPLEEVPPPAAAPHRCGRCPLAVEPPRRSPLPVSFAATLDLEALLRCRVRCGHHRCQWTAALSFHGLRSPPGFLAGFQLSTRNVSASARTGKPPSNCRRVATPAFRLPRRPDYRSICGVTARSFGSSLPPGFVSAVTSRNLRLEVCPRQSVRDPSDTIRAEAPLGSVRNRGPSWGF